MALVLVQSCCKPCEWACRACDKCADGCSKCVNDCCRMCGGACDSCCKCCGNTCDKCCGCCSEGCDGVTKWIDAFCAQPFAGCVVFAVLLNLLTFFAAVYYLATFWNNTCSKPLEIWVLVALIVFLVNVSFGIYLFMRLSKSAADVRTHDPAVSKFRNQWNKSWQFFMYDPVVALYILVYIFCLVWGIIGNVWAGAAGPTCTPELVSMTKGGGVVLLVYVFVSFTCIFCSMFSGWCNEALEDCNFFKCICCCIYYPCCYEEEQKQKERRARRQAEHQHLGDGSQQPPFAAPVVVVSPVQQQPASAPAPYAQAYTAPSYPQPQSQSPQGYQQQSAYPQQPYPQQQQQAYQQPYQQPYQAQQPHTQAYVPAQQPYQQNYQPQYAQPVYVASPVHQPQQEETDAEKAVRIGGALASAGIKGVNNMLKKL